MIEKAYNWVDDQIMKGVNAGVRAYNWTTGRTKLDLANELLCAAPILETVGAFNHHPIVAAIMTPLYLAISHRDQTRNKRLYDREIAALEKQALDIHVEREKEMIYRMEGLIWPGIGAGVSLPMIIYPTKGFMVDTQTSETCRFIGHGIRGASFWVMRADNLPPRKNCFSRGLDKLSEYATAIKGALEPQPQPVPVPVQMSAQGSYVPQALETRI